ncbi:hypothetical protein AV545_15925 [Paenibacillus jamilae]|nr:hypothetical protein AV545_15925 [Paenibacillus jamilae]
MLITLWIIVTLTFIIMHIIPGDPFSNDSKTIPETVLQNMRARYNLDKPLAVQYVLYLKNLLVLDMGPSIQSKTTDVIMNLCQPGKHPCSVTLRYIPLGAGRGLYFARWY